MTENEIRRRFPNASPGFVAANAAPDCARQNPVMERVARNESLAKDQGEKGATGRVHIRFESVRKRLCDPDNIAEKYLLDCLRYCGAIDGDEPEKITLEVCQRKTAKDEAEHTLIEVLGLL